MTKCPLCNGGLNACATVTLYDVEVSNGQIVSYQGGPTPESEEDVVDLINESGPTIACVNGHVLEAVE